MLVTKHTEESTNKFFAITDINQRAKAAYNSNPQFFNSTAHQQRVALVNQILRNMFSSYSVAYQTARAATRNRPAHTEIKFSHVVLYNRTKHLKLRTHAVAQLAKMGLQLVYKPSTNSYSVHVV